MEKLPGFSMKNSLSLPSLTNKYFNSLMVENDEPIYTYNDAFKRYFVRQTMKGRRCAALNQYYNTTISDEVFNITSKELNVNGNLYEILDKYFENENKQRKIIENENDSQFKNYRDINQDEKPKNVNDELSKLPLHKKLQKLNLIDVMMDFDATSLYLQLCMMRTVFILKCRLVLLLNRI